MATTLVAHDQAIQKIFSDDYVFHIPGYQRPYSWTVEQARELIEDLCDFIKANPGPVAGMPVYFLGSIVLIKGDAPKAWVVDGQQRLTTLTLLLAAIRANVDPGLRAQITKRLYEQGDTFAGNEDRFRLNLRERDAPFFQKYVQKEDGFAQLLALEVSLSDSQRNLRDNARLFQARLESMTEAQRIELGGFILQRCLLVTVATPDEDSAYRIFNVMNSRGLDLTATDILKAKIIGKIPESQQEAFNRKWEDAEEELGREDFNTLFGHIRTIYRKAKAKETLLKGFLEFVPAINTPTLFIDDLLLPMTRAFAEIAAAAYSAPTMADTVNEQLRWLNRLEFNDWVPPALAFTKLHRNDAPAMAKFMTDLERLAYFMLATGKDVNERIERFAKVVAEVEAGRDLYAAAADLQLTRAEQEEFYQQLNGRFYADLSAKRRTPLLLRLDSLLSSGGATYDHAVISIEHVLPQKPALESQWMQDFPDPLVRADLVHRLGNLVLLTRKKNSAANNMDFVQKRDTYFRRGVAPFALTTEVVRLDAWTEDTINERQERIMGLLEAHWRLKDRQSVADSLMESLGMEPAAATAGPGAMSRIPTAAA